MKRLVLILKSSMLRWWFMIAAILNMSSTCPCCGKPACPVGVGGAAIVSGILVMVGAVVGRIKLVIQKRSNGKASHNI